MRLPCLLLPLAASLLLAACGGAAPADKPAPATDKAAAAAPAAADGWVDADLSATPKKLPLVVKAPAGYTVAESPLGDVELAAEPVTFDVDDVTDAGLTLTGRKDDVRQNSGMVFEKFVLEQPDGFIAQMGAGNYLPVRWVKVGGRTYQFSVIPLNALPSEAARQLYDMVGMAKAK